jgi:NAD(P)-dependent dehydrogenase (short-subunit alcohol dehydrogenase family)
MTTDERRPRPKEQAGDHDQPSPGRQSAMRLQPDSDLSSYRPASKLSGLVAIVTGGDSGIGRAVAIAYALEGADVAIVYDQSDGDAADTARIVEEKGRRCLKLKGDAGEKAECERFVDETVGAFGRLDVLVNNAAYFEGGPIEEITEENLERIFRTNVFGYVFMAQAALPHLEASKGSIINTSSSTSKLGKKGAIPYSATKGAVNVFTKSLALELAERGVRVNAVVPGPFWTPAIATSDKETVKEFGSFTMVGRAGQPEEIAPAYVFLAADAPFTTGAFVEATGGFKATDA